MAVERRAFADLALQLAAVEIGGLALDQRVLEINPDRHRQAQRLAGGRHAKQHAARRAAE